MAMPPACGEAASGWKEFPGPTGGWQPVAFAQLLPTYQPESRALVPVGYHMQTSN